MLALPLLLATHIVVWHAYSGGEEAALETTVRAFNSSQTAISAEAIAVPYGSMADKLQAAIPRRHGPDVFIFANDLVGQWTRQGLLFRLDESASLKDVLARLWPQTVTPLRDGDALWGVPLAFKSLALFYRTDMVPSPPRTTGDLLALCRRFREQASPPRRYGLVYEAASFFSHAAWLHGFGGKIIPPGQELPRLDTPEELAALRFLAGMVARGDIPEEMTAVLVAQFFNQGRAAVVINGPWFIGDIAPGVPYGVAPMPRVTETGRLAAPLTSIEAGFVSAYTPHPEAAAAFLGFLAGPEGASLRMRIGRQAVSEQSAWQSETAKSDPILQAFFAQMNDMVPSPKHPGMRAFWEPGQQALRQVLRGVLPEKALRDAQHLLDFYLTPPPPEQSETPYLVGASALLLLAALALLARAQKQRLAVEMWRQRSAYAYLAPTALSLGLLSVLPLGVGAIMSFFTLTPDDTWRFVGLANFGQILLCRQGGCLEPLGFYFTLLVTILWTVTNVALHVFIGGTLALCLRTPWLRLRNVYRVLLIVPWAMPNYITALIWKGMFNRQFGAINGLLVWLGLQPIAWFSHFFTALCANIATNVWLGFPFMMVTMLGNLTQLPAELEEAAMLDGANYWQRLRHVVLPLLAPAMLPSVVLGAVWTFNMFNIVFLVSGGEPDGQTEILISQAYRWAFSRGHRYGYAAAYAVLIFLILLLQSALLRRASDRAIGD
jgi:arabinogalactan oligomer/maltooligosaccharide transport system permease protein